MDRRDGQCRASRAGQVVSGKSCRASLNKIARDDRRSSEAIRSEMVGGLQKDAALLGESLERLRRRLRDGYA
jgi:hypothetical protein